MKEEIHKKVLVTGCGRSGTKYIAVVLRSLGLDVLHERMGRDGISSWCMTVDAKQSPWGPLRGNYEFDHILHVVRHPIRAIPSIATFKASSWDLIYRHTPCSPDEPALLRSARYWYHWNEMTERIAEWRFRVEDLPNCLPNLCRRLDIPTDPSVLDRIATDTNTRRFGITYHRYEEFCLRLGQEPRPFMKHQFFSRERPRVCLSWRALCDLDPKLTHAIRSKATLYGYVE